MYICTWNGAKWTELVKERRPIGGEKKVTKNEGVMCWNDVDKKMRIKNRM